MWLTFKTRKQKIEALEDAIADKKARLEVITTVHKGADSISHFYLDKVADLTAQMAVLCNRLERYKAKSSNV